MARQEYARLLIERKACERTVKTEAGDTEAGGTAGDTEALPAEAPPVPQREQDKSVSPFDVGEKLVAQVAEAEQFLQWCRWAIDQADQYMQGSTPDVQDKIREVLGELAGKGQGGRAGAGHRRGFAGGGCPSLSSL